MDAQNRKVQLIVMSFLAIFFIFDYISPLLSNQVDHKDISNNDQTESHHHDNHQSRMRNQQKDQYSTPNYKSSSVLISEVRNGREVPLKTYLKYDSENDSPNRRNHNEQKHQSHVPSHILNILHCSSGIYNREFQVIATYVQQNYAQIIIIHDEYPPNMFYAMAIRTVEYAQYAAIITLFIGDWISQRLGIHLPQIYTEAKKHKIIAILCIYLITNAMKNYLSKTEAFEVYFDSNKLFSNVDTNKYPSTNEIIRLIDRAISSE